MGFDVHGRVEVRDYHLPDFWQGVIDLSGLVLEDSRVQADWLWNIHDDIDFSRRGLIANCSRQTRLDYRRTSPKYPETTSWVMWAELKPKLQPIAKSKQYARDWDVLYQLCLALEDKFGIDRVRLVWWLV